VQKDNTLVVHSLSEPAAKRAAHVVQASVVEVEIPINVQSDHIVVIVCPVLVLKCIVPRIFWSGYL
jgi:hypothetical protein